MPWHCLYEKGSFCPPAETSLLQATPLFSKGCGGHAPRCFFSVQRALCAALTRVCRGKLMQIDSEVNKVSFGVQYMLMSMKGVAEVMTDRDLQVPKAIKGGKGSLTKAQINLTIGYINVHGKNGVGNNESMRLAWYEHHNPASPLFRMLMDFIKEVQNKKKR
eukprot:6484704-Amphidinium_carterae.1